MSAHLVGRRGVAIAAVVFILAGGLLASSSPAIAQTQSAVEYYYGDWNFYFVTSFPEEIAALDGGAFGGAWKRTGQTFDVWTGPVNGALPTCRFFSTIFTPKSSHFYTPYADECASLQAGTGWQYEATSFYVQLPDENGNCAAGTEVLYRLYNDGMGGAPNHRFIRGVALFNQMRAAGWKFEGNGLTGAYACIPSSPAPAPTAEGRWDGTRADGGFFSGLILDTGEFFFIYSVPPFNSIRGFVQGNGRSVNGAFSSFDARDAHFGGLLFPATVVGSYSAQSTLTGTVDESGGALSFSTSYGSSYSSPVKLPAYAGTYYAPTSFALTIDAQGLVTGFWQGCSLSGATVPRGGVAVLNLTLVVTGVDCFARAQIMKGFAYFYDDAHTELVIVTINAAGAYFFVVGVRNTQPPVTSTSSFRAKARVEQTALESGSGVGAPTGSTTMLAQ